MTTTLTPIEPLAAPHDIAIELVGEHSVESTLTWAIVEINPIFCRRLAQIADSRAPKRLAAPVAARGFDRSGHEVIVNGASAEMHNGNIQWHVHGVTAYECAFRDTSPAFDFRALVAECNAAPAGNVIPRPATSDSAALVHKIMDDVIRRCHTQTRPTQAVALAA